MSRITKPLECSKSDIIDLQQLANDTSNPRVAERAKMILECAKGSKIKDVAAVFAERPNTVIKWKKRYEELGIGGLRNAPRGSTKDIYGEPFAKRLLELLESAPPNGEEYWTGPLLAEALGTPNDTIRRYLRREGIQLLEYRRHTKEGIPPNHYAGLSMGDHEVIPPDRQDLDTNIDTHAFDDSVSARDDSDDFHRETAMPQKLSDTITCKKRINVTISSTEDLRDAKARPLDVQVHVKLMDKGSCIQESHSIFPGALPHLRLFEVEINDTS